jgi:hypothetical protein
MAEEKDIIKRALERFQQAEEASSEFRRFAKEDLRFTADDQWEPLARQQRTESSRPCFTIDRINPSLRQIVNEQRQNRPAIQVDPKNGGATQLVADTMAGLIRHIEYDSNADAAYDRAGWYAAACGVGYLRLRSEYDNDQSFDQKLLIEAVADPLTVFYDPNSVQADGSDADYAFIVDSIPKTEFEYRYPEAKTIDKVKAVGGWQNYDSNDAAWMDDDNIRVAEYFYKSHKKKTLYLIVDTRMGQTYTSLEAPPQELVDAGLLTVINERPTAIPEIRWCLLTSDEILQESVFPGTRIPVIPVYGEDYYVAGERFTCGAVRRAKDAQKVLNWTTSLQAEIVDLNAKAPWVGAAGSFDGFEDQWRDANRKNFGYLEYNPTDISGNPVAAPTRNAVEAPVSAVQATKLQAVDDIKAVFGIFDAALGAQGNETSGIAILARKQQSGISNYHYYDNLVRSIRALGKILVDAIPYYYDTQRMIRIVKSNGDQELVLINGVDKRGNVIDFTQGEFDVVIQTGPTYATRRQESVESAIALIGAYPQAAPLIADIVVQNMDWPGANDIAKRLRAAVPPEVLMATDEETSGMDEEAQIQALQAQGRQQKQALEQLNAYAQKMEQELTTTKDELTLLKTKADIEVKKAEMDQLVRLKDIELREQTTELDFLVKEQELVIQKQQLELEKAKLAMAGVKAMSEVEDKIFERSGERVVSEAMQFDAVDTARPSELKESPTGI